MAIVTKQISNEFFHLSFDNNEDVWVLRHFDIYRDGGKLTLEEDMLIFDEDMLAHFKDFCKAVVENM